MDMAAIPIKKANHFPVRNTKSPIAAFRLVEFPSLLSRSAPLDRKNRILLMGSNGSPRNVTSRPSAWVDKSSIAQPSPCLEIQRSAPALIKRPLMPFNSKPSQVFDGRIRIIRLASIGIEILNPQDRNPSGLHDSFMSLPESRRMAHMEITGRRRGDPPPVMSL